MNKEKLHWHNLLIEEYKVHSNTANKLTGLIWYLSTGIFALTGVGLKLLTTESLDFFASLMISIFFCSMLFFYVIVTNRWHELLTIYYERLKKIEGELDLHGHLLINKKDKKRNSSCKVIARIYRLIAKYKAIARIYRLIAKHKVIIKIYKAITWLPCPKGKIYNARIRLSLLLIIILLVTPFLNHCSKNTEEQEESTEVIILSQNKSIINTPNDAEINYPLNQLYIFRKVHKNRRQDYSNNNSK